MSAWDFEQESRGVIYRILKCLQSKEQLQNTPQMARAIQIEEEVYSRANKAHSLAETFNLWENPDCVNTYKEFAHELITNMAKECGPYWRKVETGNISAKHTFDKFCKITTQTKRKKDGPASGSVSAPAGIAMTAGNGSAVGAGVSRMTTTASVKPPFLPKPNSNSLANNNFEPPNKKFATPSSLGRPQFIPSNASDARINMGPATGVIDEMQVGIAKEKKSKKHKKEKKKKKKKSKGCDTPLSDGMLGTNGGFSTPVATPNTIQDDIFVNQVKVISSESGTASEVKVQNTASWSNFSSGIGNLSDTSPAKARSDSENSRDGSGSLWSAVKQSTKQKSKIAEQIAAEEEKRRDALRQAENARKEELERINQAALEKERLLKEEQDRKEKEKRDLIQQRRAEERAKRQRMEQSVDLDEQGLLMENFENMITGQGDTGF